MNEDEIPLRDYVDRVLADRDHRYEERDRRYTELRIADREAVVTALTAAKEAVAFQEGNAEKWRAAANEWRGAMADRERTFPSRTEVEQGFGAIREKIDTLAALVGAMGIRLERAEGRGQGLQAGWGYLAGVIGLAATVIGIVLAVR